jgi:hypothetical protein
VVLALLLGSACEYDLDVGADWQISHSRVIALRMEVVEPAPIWPERLNAAFGDGPIAEALPGDRVRLVPLVVDGEGREQPPESLDALWFQCGAAEYPECSLAVPRCDSLDWTTDVACEIGRGGAHEFTFPALGPMGLEQRSMVVLGIVGRDPTADAERCRAGLLSGTSELSACTLIEAHVLIGPRWVLQYVAVDSGLTIEFPLYEIPALALLQPANRPPAPDPPVWRDADTNEILEGSPPRIRPGQRVKTSGPTWAADRQPFVKVRIYDDGYLFEGEFESRGALYFASGPIWFSEIAGSRLQFVVDDDARAGIVRVVIVVGDDRGSDNRWGAVDMLVTELEVVP